MKSDCNNKYDMQEYILFCALLNYSVLCKYIYLKKIKAYFFLLYDIFVTFMDELNNLSVYLYYSRIPDYHTIMNIQTEVNKF